MAKRAINLDKLEDVPTPLLMEGISKLINRLKYIEYLELEKALDTNYETGAARHKKRRELLTEMEKQFAQWPGDYGDIASDKSDPGSGVNQ